MRRWDSLGDSGYSIIRGGKVIFAAPSQTHYFNCPVSVVESARTTKLTTTLL